MAKFYFILLCIYLIGMSHSFGQTGCLYNGDIYTGASASNPGVDNYGYYSGDTPVGTKCPSATQIPCRVYYWTGVNDYFSGVKSDYNTINCPIDNGSLGLMVCSGILGCYVLRKRIPQSY